MVEFLDFFYILSNERQLILLNLLNKMSAKKLVLDFSDFFLRFCPIKNTFSPLSLKCQTVWTAIMEFVQFSQTFNNWNMTKASSSTLWIPVTSLVWSDPKITKYGPQHSTRGTGCYSQKKLLKYLNTPQMTFLHNHLMHNDHSNGNMKRIWNIENLQYGLASCW